MNSIGKSKKGLALCIVTSYFAFAVLFSGGEKGRFLQEDGTVTSTPAPKDEISTSSRPKPKTIFFLHLSKSGGTSVCNIMKEHSEIQMTDRDGNVDLHRESCDELFPKNGVWQYGEWTEPRQCADLVPYTTDSQGRAYQRNNYVTVESTWYDEMPCPGYRSFSIMRHPVERMVSLINYEGLNQKTVLKYLRGEDIPEGEDDFTLAQIRDKATAFNTEHPFINVAPPNSWTIRQLLGYDRKIDERPIDENDFERAKVLVDKFDAFVPLEFLSHPNVLQKLNETVPEYYRALVKSGNAEKHTNAHEHKQALSSAEDEELKELLYEQNKYDLMLYQYVLDKNGIKVLDEFGNEVPVQVRIA